HDAIAVLSQHIYVTPPSPVVLNPHVSSELAMVMMTILAKDPNARFRSASALTVALAQALHVTPPALLKQPPSRDEMESMSTYVISPMPPGEMGTTPASQGEMGTIPSIPNPISQGGIGASPSFSNPISQGGMGTIPSVPNPISQGGMGSSPSFSNPISQ